MIWIYML